MEAINRQVSQFLMRHYFTLFHLFLGSSGEYRELSYRTEINILHNVIGNHINDTLIVPKVTREHEGSFLCEVNNGIGAGLSALFKIKVHGKILNIISSYKKK